MVASLFRCNIPEAWLKRWWRVGLNRTQLAMLEQDAQERVAIYGSKAHETALQRARALGRRHHKEAAWLSRVAACIREEQRGTCEMR